MPFPPPGDLPNPGIEPTSSVSPALAGEFFTTAPPGSPYIEEEYIKRKTLLVHRMNLINIFLSTRWHTQNMYCVISFKFKITNIKKKDVHFNIGDWNAKVGSQEIPGVTGKVDLGIQNEAGQRLIEFCQRTCWS